MHNVEDDGAPAGRGPGDDPAGMHGSQVARRSRPGKRAVLGVAGLAAVLGAGAFVVTTVIDNAGHTGTGNAGALAPAQHEHPTGAVPGGTGTPAGGTPAHGGTPSAAAPGPATSKPKTDAQRVADARNAAKAGPKVLQPLPHNPDGMHVAADDIKVKTFGTVHEDHKTLRVVSARGDLSGQHELGWVADAGEAVGDAQCSQNFRFAGGRPVVEKPTLLVCWRLSATKSVYTVAVRIDGRPSKEESVAAIDEAWSKL
jgi:hypothetical protein